MKNGLCLKTKYIDKLDRSCHQSSNQVGISDLLLSVNGFLSNNELNELFIFPRIFR